MAAASLGQVYKAKLRKTGEIVAVKVQRPAVLETVSLDLYLARELGFITRNFPALVERIDAGESAFPCIYMCLYLMRREDTCFLTYAPVA